jgi:hypothetical protein
MYDTLLFSVTVNATGEILGGILNTYNQTRGRVERLTLSADRQTISTVHFIKNNRLPSQSYVDE